MLVSLALIRRFLTRCNRSCTLRSGCTSPFGRQQYNMTANVYIVTKTPHMLSQTSWTMPNQPNKYDSITPGSVWGVADKAVALDDFLFPIRPSNGLFDRIHLHERNGRFFRILMFH